MRKLSIRIAQITSQFMEMVKRLVDKPIYKTPAFKGGKKWLTIYKVTDPESDNSDFYYVERLGKDSVAFLLVDHDREGEFGILQQFSSPYRKFFKGAFTGSLDKPELSVQDIVVEEIKEEAGYDVSGEADQRIIPCGTMPVLSSTNETVNLFMVDVTGLQQQRKAPENIFEENMNIYWVGEDQIREQCEWRAHIILCRWKKQYNVNASVSAEKFHKDLKNLLTEI